MFNVYNINEQTIAPGEAIILDGVNFSPKCGCRNTNNFIGTGVYRISASVNSTPTVAGQIIWNLTADNVVIPGGTIQIPGTTIGTYENGSAEVIIPVEGRTSIQIVNNSANPVTIPARGISLVARRVA